MRRLPALTAATAILGAAILGTLAAAPAHAVGGGGASETPTCPQDQRYDGRLDMCVDKTSAIDDGSLTEYAYALTQEGRYEEAIATLDQLQEPVTPEALNYRGYAMRKLGRVEESIAYYLHSVALDPEYTQVRGYLGEAYVTLGRLDLAREQLAEIEKRCGTTCEAYGALAEALAAADA